MPRSLWIKEPPTRRWPPAPSAASQTLCPRCLGTGYVTRPGFAGIEKYRGEAERIPCSDCHAAGRVLRSL